MIDNHSSAAQVVDELLLAIHDLWTGELKVSADGSPFGSIYLSRGRIAWATCEGQSETLGVFLWRLGRISREQLAQVQETYKASQGEKMLGRVLEEAGLMSRAVLRRCIMLHTRSAIAKILSNPVGISTRFESARSVDEGLLFRPEEVMPADLSGTLLSEFSGVDNTWVRSWYVLSRENLILAGLAETTGYSASAIISYDGDVVTAHTMSRDVDLTTLAAHVAATLEASLRAMRSTRDHDIDWIVIDCQQGGLVARWLDADRRWLVFMLYDEVGKSSMARYALRAEWDALQRWIEQRGARGRGPVAQPTMPEAPVQVAWPEEQASVSDLFDAKQTQREDCFNITRSSDHDKRPGSDIFAAVKPPKD